MPFTFAHPAAVLPFVRSRLSFIGLAVGSMTPDFEYFFRLRVSSTISHTLEGLFLFDLPVGFLFGLLFQGVIYKNLYAALPANLRYKLNAPHYDSRAKVSLSILFLIIISVLTGASTHLLWDAFTHADGFVVRQASFLSETPIMGFPVFKILQHVSTFAGLSILVFFFLKQPSTPRPSPRIPYYWTVIFTCISTLLLLKLCLSSSTNPGDLLVTGIAGLMYGMIIAGFLPSLQKGGGVKPRLPLLQTKN